MYNTAAYISLLYIHHMIGGARNSSVAAHLIKSHLSALVTCHVAFKQNVEVPTRTTETHEDEIICSRGLVGVAVALEFRDWKEREGGGPSVLGTAYCNMAHKFNRAFFL